MCRFDGLPAEMQAALIENGLAPWEAGLEPDDVKLPDRDVGKFAALVTSRADTSRVIERLNRYLKIHMKGSQPCLA